MKTFAEYQAAAVDTALETAYKPEYLFPGLAAEAGEVCGKFAKYVRDVNPLAKPANTETYAKFREDLGYELGDVLWFVAVLADFYQFKLEDIATMNRAKLSRRKERGTLNGSGDSR
jgi:NTP pyrophosphatase (non-canonical NTP hydrolase)